LKIFLPTEAESGENWSGKFDEAVKSQKPDGFEKSSIYGAQIPAA
jgi:hypothetical protein